MRKIFCSVIGVIIGASTPVFAADMALNAPPPAPVAPASSWNGFYAGVNAGVGWPADPTASFTPNPPPPGGGLVNLVGAGLPVSFGMTGEIVGFQVGYNWNVNQQWLLGVETDFDFSNVKGSGTSNNLTPVVLPFTSSADERIDWFGTVRARMGYLPTNNLLVFGTAALLMAE